MLKSIDEKYVSNYYQQIRHKGQFNMNDISEEMFRPYLDMLIPGWKYLGVSHQEASYTYHNLLHNFS